MTKFKELRVRQMTEAARNALAREKRAREQTRIAPFEPPTLPTGRIDWDAFRKAGPQESTRSAEGAGVTAAVQIAGNQQW
jgi:hypothetical protein